MMEMNINLSFLSEIHNIYKNLSEYIDPILAKILINQIKSVKNLPDFLCVERLEEADIIALLDFLNFNAFLLLAFHDPERLHGYPFPGRSQIDSQKIIKKLTNSGVYGHITCLGLEESIRESLSNILNTGKVLTAYQKRIK